MLKRLLISYLLILLFIVTNLSALKVRRFHGKLPIDLNTKTTLSFKFYKTADDSIPLLTELREIDVRNGKFTVDFPSVLIPESSYVEIHSADDGVLAPRELMRDTEEMALDLTIGKVGNDLKIIDRTGSSGLQYQVLSADASGDSIWASSAFYFHLSANPSWRGILIGSNTSTSITATNIMGTSTAVTFYATGLPTGATASLSPTSCNPGTTCSSTMSISTSTSTPYGFYPVTITGIASTGAMVSTTFTLGMGLPSQVTGLTATGGASKISLSWNAPASGNHPMSYMILRGTSSGGESFLTPFIIR